MKVSFGSTYAIDYNYRLFKAYGYTSKLTNIRNFVDLYNKHGKGKEEISAINPQSGTYYIKIPDNKDLKFENIIRSFGITQYVKRVNMHEMEGATISSIGNVPNEIFRLSQIISKQKDCNR